mmetsp:Transcript_13580/g.42430  ORF Transcript_13580/g.42430 Transcript_13580/m.42430 type:complete len:214 (+) Transcript_13580:403-1044(+)
MTVVGPSPGAAADEGRGRPVGRRARGDGGHALAQRVQPVVVRARGAGARSGLAFLTLRCSRRRVLIAPARLQLARDLPHPPRVLRGDSAVQGAGALGTLLRECLHAPADLAKARHALLQAADSVLQGQEGLRGAPGPAAPGAQHRNRRHHRVRRRGGRRGGRRRHRRRHGQRDRRRDRTRRPPLPLDGRRIRSREVPEPVNDPAREEVSGRPG